MFTGHYGFYDDHWSVSGHCSEGKSCLILTIQHFLMVFLGQENDFALSIVLVTSKCKYTKDQQFSAFSNKAKKNKSFVAWARTSQFLAQLMS